MKSTLCGPVHSSQLTSHSHGLYAYKQIGYHSFINITYQCSLISVSATLRKPFTFSFAYDNQFFFQDSGKTLFLLETISKLSPHLKTINNSFTYITIALSLHFKSKLCHFNWSFTCLFWRSQWQPTPVLSPGKSHGWRSLVGCSPWGR